MIRKIVKIRERVWRNIVSMFRMECDKGAPFVILVISILEKAT